MGAEQLAHRKLSDIVSMLMADCACRRNAPDHALQLLHQLSDGEGDPRWAIFKGDIYALNQQWDEAARCWIHAVETVNGDKEIAGRLSDCLLRAAVNFFEKRDWRRLLQCVVAARTADPSNPNISYLPSNLETDLPVAYYADGNYEQAALIWKHQLIEKGVVPELVHKLGICHLSRADDETATIRQRMEAVVNAYMYWCVLQYQEKYWLSVYQKRKEVYQSKISWEDYWATTPSFSITHCELMLDQIRQLAEGDEQEEITRQYQLFKDQMALEKYSAGLLAQWDSSKKKDWPYGGFKFLATLWGEKRLANKISNLEETEVGGTLWKIKGLYQKELRPSFISYLSGGYEACFHSTQKQSDRRLKNLMGLAIIALAENYIQSHRYSKVPMLAEYIGKIPDPSTQALAVEKVSELAENGFQSLIHQGRNEDARKLAEGLITHLPLPSIMDNLAGLYLKQCEEIDLKKSANLSKLYTLFDKALNYSQQIIVCERYLKKVVQYHLNTLQIEKNWNEIESFLTSLNDRYQQFSFLESQRHFYLAARLMERYGEKDNRVLGHLQKAYELDNSDNEIAQIYSMSLSAKAVAMVNDADPSSMENVANEAVDLLKKALKMTPGNGQVKKALMDLTQMCFKAGINLPQESLMDVAKMVKFST